MWIMTNVPVQYHFFQQVRVAQRVLIYLKNDPLAYTGRVIRKGEYNGLLIRLDSGGETKVNTTEISSARILPESGQMELFLEWGGTFFYL